jgi:hypothetical protein
LWKLLQEKPIPKTLTFPFVKQIERETDNGIVAAHYIYIRRKRRV